MRKDVRTFEVVSLIAVSVFGLKYFIPFGFLMIHGPIGGLVGFPLEIILILYSSIIIFSKSSRYKRIFRVINYTYLATLTLYVATIKIIWEIKSVNVFEYLYSSTPPGLSLSEKMFGWFSIGGMIIGVVILSVDFLLKKKQKVIAS